MFITIDIRVKRMPRQTEENMVKYAVGRGGKGSIDGNYIRDLSIRRWRRGEFVIQSACSMLFGIKTKIKLFLYIL